MTVAASRARLAVLEPAPAATSRRDGRLLVALFVLIFVWWAAGLSGFVQAIVAVPLLVVVVVRRWTKVPRGFGLWLLFLGWMVVTAVRIDEIDQVVAFGWRFSVSIAATVLFLYVYNASPEALPARRVLNALAGLWVLTVIGGLIGMLVPALSFRTPIEMLLPRSLLADPTLRDQVHAAVAAERAFSALPIYRPQAPFQYVNQWGSMFALTLPFAFAALSMARGLWRLTLRIALAISILPLVFSLNRGAWLATAVMLGYVAVRLAHHRQRRGLVTLVVSVVVLTTIVIATPLGNVITVRLEKGFGDQKRLLLYDSALEVVARSPIFGYGQPIELSVVVPGAPPGPSIGTHGMFWTVLVSHGVPGAALFLAWLLWILYQTARRGPPRRASFVRPDAGAIRFWCNAAILVALVELPYYELIPWGLPVVMTAAALALREQRSDLAYDSLASTGGAAK